MKLIIDNFEKYTIQTLPSLYVELQKELLKIKALKKKDDNELFSGITETINISLNY